MSTVNDLNNEKHLLAPEIETPALNLHELVELMCSVDLSDPDQNLLNETSIDDGNGGRIYF